MARKALRWSVLLVGACALLITVMVVAMYTSFVQEMVRSRGVSFLRGRSGVAVNVDGFRLRFPLEVELNGVLVPGPEGDTLLFARRITGSVDPVRLLKGRILVSAAELEGIRARIVEDATGQYNFHPLIEGFRRPVTSAVPENDTAVASTFLLKELRVLDAKVEVSSQRSRSDMRFGIGALRIRMDGMDLSSSRFQVDAFELSDATIGISGEHDAPVPDPYPELTDPFGGLDITMKKADLRNIAMALVKTDARDSLHVRVRRATLLCRAMDMARQRFDLEQVAVIGADLFQLSHQSSKAAVREGDPPWLGQQDGFRYWTRGMNITADRLDVEGSSVEVHRDQVRSPKAERDPDHLVLEELEVHARDIAFSDARLAVAVERAGVLANDRLHLEAGLRLKANKDNVEIADAEFRVDGLALQLAVNIKSGDPERFHDDPFNIPFEVRARSEVDGRSVFSLIQRFGSSVGRMPVNERCTADILLKGTVHQLDTVLVLVQGDRGTRLDLQAQVSNGPQWSVSSGEVWLRTLTLSEGTMPIVRSLVPSDVVLPSRLDASAHATRTGSKAQVELQVRTDLGTVVGDLVAVGSEEEPARTVHAVIDLSQVRVSRFLHDTAFAPLSAHLLLAAEHAVRKDRTGHFELRPTVLRYRGEDLSSTVVSVDVDKDSVQVRASIQTRVLTTDLGVHARSVHDGDTISGAFDMAIAVCDLGGLAKLGRTLRTSGQWHGAFATTTDGVMDIDIIGDSVSVANEDRSFAFTTFQLRGGLAKDTTYLTLNSDALTLEEHSNAPLDSVLSWAGNGLAGLINGETIAQDTSHGRATVELRLLRPELLTGLLFPSLRTIELKTFKGELRPNDVAFEMDMPELVFDSVHIDGLDLSVRTRNGQLDGSLDLDSAVYGPYLIRRLSWTASSAPGALFTRLLVKRENGAAKYDLPITFRRNRDELIVHLENGFVLNGTPWNVDPGNLLRFKDGTLRSEALRLNSALGSLELNTVEDETTIVLNKFGIGSLLNIVEMRDSVPFAEGMLTGEVGFPARSTGRAHAELAVQDLKLGGDPLGDVSLVLRATGPASYQGDITLSNGPNEVKAAGNYDGSGRMPEAHGSAELDLSDVSFLQPFLQDALFDLRGGVKGDVDWSLAEGRNKVRGDLRFSEALIGVRRTGALYSLKNERVLADESGLHFDRFTIRDSLGSAFVLDGDALTNDMRSFRFDLDLRTDSFQLLNAEQSSASSFYGDLFASTDVHVSGTDAAPVVTGDLRVLDGTDLSIVLPGSKVKLITGEGVVEFTSDLYRADTLAAKSDAERMRDSLRARLPELDLDLAVKLDTGALFQVVLDPVTGDAAYFQGNADLRFQYAPGGRMFLNGPFIASSGGYTLDFYGLVKKKFDLVRGSSVTWDGDPAKARLDVQAKYVSSTAAYPLVANATGALPDAERNRLSARMPFEVRIHANGPMVKPAITFGLDLPRMYRNSYPRVNDELDRLAVKGQEEERNRQVFGLLVLNSFIQDEATGGTRSSGIASSAARGSVNGILTDQLNKLTGQYVRGVDIELGVNTVDQTAGSSVYRRTSVDYKVSKRFMNDRLSFEVGGSVGVDETRNDVRNVSSTRAAQYAIMYDLSRDGRFRLRGFYENAFDLYDGDITDNGVALMYTRDFEENEEGRERDREQVRRELAQERARQRAEEEGNERSKGTGPKDVDAVP